MPPETLPAALPDKFQEAQVSKDEKRRIKTTQGALYQLTPRELRYAKARAAGESIADAARTAGCRHESGRARSSGWRMEQKPIVRAAIHDLQSQALTAANITPDEWYRNLARIAFIPDDQLDGKFRPGDKLKALEMLGTAIKTLSKHATHNVNVSILGLIRKADERISKVPVTLEQPPGQPGG